MYALVDGNNFYVSCERAFRPSLKNHPVVVLSNNDGCAISRSNEAKALGIKMGAPWHIVKQQMPDAGVVALSANFTLYGDMSNRLMSIAAGLGPEQEIYSIDECFISLDGVRGDLVDRSHRLRERILQWIGIPCGIGIGRTKTLAKLANHIAKSADRIPGSYPASLARVCNLAVLPAGELKGVLAATDVGDVWGIGKRTAERLNALSIKSVADLARMDPVVARMKFSVMVERTVRELQGMPCIDFEDAPPPKKEIASTRSFGRAITDLPPLIEAVSEFAMRAGEKLRRQNHVAGQVLTFVHTSPHKPGPQYSRAVTMPLRRPSADSADLVHAAIRGMRAIYRPGYKMAKAGVMLLDLQPASIHQEELDLGEGSPDRSRLMTAMDQLNQRYGKGTLMLASAGTAGDQRLWSMRQEMRTPHYTTRWKDVPLAMA
ncbi:MAG: Y-family DNA polymerase [Ramlibacter sp.]|nr:Y-family DNA polymerase [Ramlibacter sp.]